MIVISSTGRVSKRAFNMSVMNSSWCRITITLIALAWVAWPCLAIQKRCFVCNSRGPMGDCKDPFYYNSTQAKPGTDIEDRPCPSGWCGKSVQTKESDSILQTQRFCLQRPPSDGIERCALTILGEHGGQERFMCFCRGDLCNASERHHPHRWSWWWSTLLLLIVRLTF